MTLEILNSNVEIQKMIFDATMSLIQKNFSSVSSKFYAAVKPQITEMIQSSEIYDGLTNGDLQGDFGIEDAGEVDAVVDELADIQLELTKDGFVAFYDSPGFFEVVGLSKQTGSAVPWLEWLMLEGDKIIVEGFSVTTDIPEMAESRSGKAVMIAGGDFRVRPEYSGTEGDNWITRLLISSLPEIKVITAKAMRDALGGLK